MCVDLKFEQRDLFVIEALPVAVYLRHSHTKCHSVTSSYKVSQCHIIIHLLPVPFDRRKWPPGGTFLSHWGAEEEV